MECHDRYFMIAVDLSFTGGKPRFDAVGKSCPPSIKHLVKLIIVCS